MRRVATPVAKQECKKDGDPRTVAAEDAAVLVVGYLGALLLAPVGFIVGLVVLCRGHAPGHGVAMMLMSAVALWISWNYVLY